MRFAYVDSCVWITLIEGLESYRPTIRNALARLSYEGWELCASDAVRLEVLVRPQRLGDDNLIGIYEALLDATRVLPVRPSIFRDALLTATRERLKAMDAVHVAIAAQHGCERFVTTDPHFQDLTDPSSHLIALPAAKVVDTPRSTD